MRLRLTLLLLCFALPAYATDTALIDRDGVTQPLVLTLANLGAATAAQGNLAGTALQPGGIINITQAPYNADSTGASDVTTILSSAITAASTAGGGTVYLPHGKYKFTPPLVLPANVKLRGDGFSTDDSYLNASATILSVGTTYNGPAISIGTGTAIQYGNGVENLTIWLNEKARGGLYLNAAASGSYKNIFILGNTNGSAPTYAQYGYYLTASSGTNINTMFNVFENVKASMVNNILKFGYAALSNVCHNSFTNTGGSFYTDGFDLAGGDNNNFSLTYLFDRPGATGYGVKITHGAANDSTYFNHLESGRGMYIGSNASAVVFGYDQTNGQPDPVLQDSTASLSWTTDSAYSDGWHLSGNLGLSPSAVISDGTVSKTLAQLANPLPSVTNDAQLKASQLVTTVGSPGSNTSVPSEKAVRDAIASSASGLSDPGANGVVKRTSLNTTSAAGFADIVSLFGSGSCSGYLKNDGTCATTAGMTYPAAGVPNSTGSAWGTSYTVGNGASNLLQLDASSRLLLGTVATPTYSLDMDVASGGGIRVNAASGQSTIHLAQAGTDNGQIVAKGGAGTDIGINAARYLYLQTAGANRATFAQDGTVLFGPVSTAQAISGTYQFTRDQSNSGLMVQTAGANYFPYIGLIKANGTLAAPTAVTSGQDLGEIQLAPYNGSAYINSFVLQGVAAENWTTSAQGYHVAFATRPTGSNATPTERLRITSGGMMAEGLTDYTASFTVANSTSSIVLASGTATVTLPKTLPAGSTSVLVTVSGAAASGVSFAAESGGSVSFGDAGASPFTNGKAADVVCISENSTSTTTAAWRCVKGGNF